MLVDCPLKIRNRVLRFENSTPSSLAGAHHGRAAQRADGLLRVKKKAVWQPVRCV